MALRLSSALTFMLITPAFAQGSARCTVPSAPLCGMLPVLQTALPPCSPEKQARAKKSFSRFKVALERGARDRALTELDRVEEACPNPHLLLTRAHLHWESAQLLQERRDPRADAEHLLALNTVTQYLAQVPPAQWMVPSGMQVDPDRARHEGRVAWLQRLLCEEGARFARLCVSASFGQTILVQGRAVPLSAGHGAVWLMPGRVDLACDGKARTMVLQAGETAEQCHPPEPPIALPKEPGLTAPPAVLIALPPQPRYPLRRPWLAWTAGGSVALAAGSVLLGLGGRAASLDGTCSEPPPGCGLLYDGRPYAIGALTTGSVLLLGGGAALGYGLWLRAGLRR